MISPHLNGFNLLCSEYIRKLTEGQTSPHAVKQRFGSVYRCCTPPPPNAINQSILYVILTYMYSFLIDATPKTVKDSEPDG